MTTWRVGMKAVCVDDDWHLVLGPGIDASLPKLGQVYLVDGVDHLGEDTYLWLGGPLLSKARFDASSFRPAVSRPTDISIFKELLHDPHQQIREDA